METVNLPVFQSTLVDGGLTVQTQTVTSDPVVVVGFSAVTLPSTNTIGPYINQPIMMTTPDATSFIYGPALSGCSLSQAIYEVAGGGANIIYAFNLGPWGSATYTDPVTGNVSNIFNQPWTPASGYAHSFINLSGYYLALEYAYSLLEGFQGFKELYVADAYANDVVTFLPRQTNFAYQMAANLYDINYQFNECTGIINMPPATSGTLQGVNTYVGTAPQYGPTGQLTANGTGLLGFQYMVGGSGQTASAALPGFWKTTFDTTNPSLYHLPPQATSEIATDAKGNPVDIGKYISIVADEPQFTNGAFQVGGNISQINISGATNTYYGLGGGVYAGFYSTLQPQSGPTQKQLPTCVTGLRYYKSLSQLDALDGARYVTFMNTTHNGIVVTDDPLASRPTSDYKWLTTIRIVNAVLSLSRTAASPFIGEGNTAANRNALQTQLDKLYQNMVSAGAIQQYNFTVTASPSDQVLGNMYVNLTIVPAFETKKINCIINLAPSISNG